MTPDPSKLRSLLSEATARPWSVEKAVNGNWLEYQGKSIGRTFYEHFGALREDANAALIVAAVNALEGLLDEVDQNGCCEGCGSIETVEQIRATHPTAFTCCPERKMLSAEQWRARALAAEAKVKEAEGVIEPFARQRPHKNEDGSNGILVPATVADVRNARQFLTQEPTQ